MATNWPISTWSCTSLGRLPHNARIFPTLVSRSSSLNHQPIQLEELTDNRLSLFNHTFHQSFHPTTFHNDPSLNRWVGLLENVHAPSSPAAPSTPSAPTPGSPSPQVLYRGSPERHPWSAAGRTRGNCSWRIGRIGEGETGTMESLQISLLIGIGNDI